MRGRERERAQNRLAQIVNAKKLNNRIDNKEIGYDLKSFSFPTRKYYFNISARIRQCRISFARKIWLNIKLIIGGNVRAY